MATYRDLANKLCEDYLAGDNDIEGLISQLRDIKDTMPRDTEEDAEIQ